MLFIIHWTIATENRNAAMARFAQTGGAPPPGLNVHGRWHAVGQAMGFAIAETDDLELISKWVLDWSDLMSMQVYPAITDVQAAPLLTATLAMIAQRAI
ncbi:MAG: DUF3303 family protein [Pseudomonas sp.]